MTGIFPSLDEAKRIKVIVMLAALFDNHESEKMWQEHYAHLSLDEKIAQLERESGLT